MLLIITVISQPDRGDLESDVIDAGTNGNNFVSERGIPFIEQRGVILVLAVAIITCMAP